MQDITPENRSLRQIVKFKKLQRNLALGHPSLVQIGNLHNPTQRQGGIQQLVTDTALLSNRIPFEAVLDRWPLGRWGGDEAGGVDSHDTQ